MINETEAQAIQRATEIVLTDPRHSLYKAEQAASEIVGKKIGVKRLRDTLMSARIAGLREHFPLKEREAWLKEGRSYEDRRATVVEAEWEPIISERELWALRKLLADPSR